VTGCVSSGRDRGAFLFAEVALKEVRVNTCLLRRPIDNAGTVNSLLGRPKQRRSRYWCLFITHKHACISFCFMQANFGSAAAVNSLLGRAKQRHSPRGVTSSPWTLNPNPNRPPQAKAFAIILSIRLWLVRVNLNPCLLRRPISATPEPSTLCSAAPSKHSPRGVKGDPLTLYPNCC